MNTALSRDIKDFTQINRALFIEILTDNSADTLFESISHG